MTNHETTQPIGTLAPADPIAEINGTIVSYQQFCDDVQTLCQQLPKAQYAINLNTGRYSFLVSLIAAHLMNQITLLPPNNTPKELASLQHHYPDSYCIISADTPTQDAAIHDSPNHPLVLLDSMGHMTGVSDTPPIDVTSATSLSCHNPDQPFCILFTSGSTGKPQACIKTFAQLATKARLMAQLLKLDVTPKSLVATVASQHMFGLEHSIMLALYSKATLVDGATFFPEDIESVCKQCHFSPVLISTPYHLNACLKAHMSPTRLSMILTATAPMPHDLAYDLEQQFNTKVLDLFGCSELGAIATRQPSHTPLWQTIPGVELQNRKGVTWAIDNNTSLETPLYDNCTLIDAHHFEHMGRTQDQLNVAGKRIMANKLNQMLTSLEGVDDGVIVQLPSPDLNSRPLGIVVSSLSDRHLTQALRKSCDPCFVPKQWLFVKTLNRNANGKIIQHELHRLIETHYPKPCFIIDDTHPALAGHFPNNPIVPGVVIIDHIVELANHKDLKVDPNNLPHIKFHHILSPNMCCEVDFNRQSASLGFKLQVDSTLIATGSFGIIL